MNNKPRYELHFEDQVLEGTLEELRDFAKGIKPHWKIFAIYGSDLNIHRYKRFTVSEVREIISLRKKQWTYTGIADKFHSSHTRMRLMVMALNI